MIYMETFVLILYLLGFGLGSAAIVMSIIVNKQLQSPLLSGYLILISMGTLNFVSGLFDMYSMIRGYGSLYSASVVYSLIVYISAVGLPFLFVNFVHHLLEVEHLQLKNSIFFFIIAIPNVSLFLLEWIKIDNDVLTSWINVNWMITTVVYYLALIYVTVLIAFRLKTVKGSIKRYILSGIMIIFIIYIPISFVDNLITVHHPIISGMISGGLFYLFWNLISIILADKFIFNLSQLGKGHRLSVDLKEQYSLTDREEEIAVHLLQGLSNQEIADKLFISLQTVKSHLYNIYRKTDVKNRMELSNLFR